MTTWDLMLYSGSLVTAVALIRAALGYVRGMRRMIRTTRRISGRREPGAPPRHTRDLFGRAGATATDGLGLDTIPDGVLCREFDWPTAQEIEDAWWDWKWHSFDERLAKIAHDGTLRLVAAGVPLDVIAEHSVAEVLRHERAVAVADALTGEWPALVGAA